MNVFIGFYTMTFIRNQILFPKSNLKIQNTRKADYLIKFTALEYT